MRTENTNEENNTRSISIILYNNYTNMERKLKFESWGSKSAEGGTLDKMPYSGERKIVELISSRKTGYQVEGNW